MLFISHTVTCMINGHLHQILLSNTCWLQELEQSEYIIFLISIIPILGGGLVPDFSPLTVDVPPEKAILPVAPCF